MLNYFFTFSHFIIIKIVSSYTKYFVAYFDPENISAKKDLGLIRPKFITRVYPVIVCRVLLCSLHFSAQPSSGCQASCSVLLQAGPHQHQGAPRFDV